MQVAIVLLICRLFLRNPGLTGGVEAAIGVRAHSSVKGSAGATGLTFSGNLSSGSQLRPKGHAAPGKGGDGSMLTSARRFSR